MSDKNIKSSVEEVLNIGYKILLELEKKDPDVEEIQKLYEYRSEAIDKMKKNNNQQAETLSENQKEAAKDLFTRLQVLEKQLNKNLAMLSARKKEALKQLDDHTEAKKSYIQSSNQYQNKVSKIVDLKSQD